MEFHVFNLCMGCDLHLNNRAGYACQVRRGYVCIFTVVPGELWPESTSCNAGARLSGSSCFGLTPG